MAVNHEHKVAFIHITKTGGVTMQDELGLENNGDGHIEYNHFRDKYPGYDINAIVRNPYDRFVSAYAFMELYNKNKPNKQRYKHYTDLGIKGVAKIFDDIGHNCTALLRPQYTFVCNDDGNIACNIYKFEKLYDAYVDMCKKINKEPKDILPVHNSSGHKDYRLYYNEEMKEQIYKYYQKDFELFGYNKEL